MAKTENPLPFFQYYNEKKLTLTLIFEGVNWAFFSFFCSSAVVH